MIAAGSECPAWIRELHRFLPLKNLIFVYGNILDLISYPITKEGTSDVAWTESTLTLFFKRLLSGMGYEVIGFFDPVDGLTWPEDSPQMADIYKKLQKGKPINPPAIDVSKTPQDSGKQKCDTGDCSSNVTQETVASKKWGASDPLRDIDGVRNALTNKSIPTAFVFNLASRLVTSPANLAKTEREMFTKLLKASMNSNEIIREESRWNNVLIFVCDKLNDVPAFLYLNNPRARSIHIPKPDTADRTRFIKRTFRAFHKDEQSPAEPTQELISLFASLTEGMANYEMTSLVSLSLKEKIPIQNVRNLCERYKYGITESEWDKVDKSTLDNAEAEIRKSIKGQDVAMAAVLDIIKRAKIGLAAGADHRVSRPRGVLFFAGPTGVGKTEMAKAMARLLFGQEDRCIRFDMSEYSAQHADQRLLGAPPGYVGYEEGGQLTNAVREHPFSILLFDEIEKAHGSIFDKFLQILDDGRLTDGKGDTVYFSESIIIFTSNLGTVTATGDSGEERAQLIEPDMPYHKIKKIILQAIRQHFNFKLGRPEILNRFGENFVIFDFIRPPLDEEIVDLLLAKLKDATREHRKNGLTISKPVRDKLVSLARKNLQHGGRGIRNVIDSALVNPLNRALFDLGVEEGADVTLLELRDNGEDVPNRFELKLDYKKAAN
jgi:ATP-dependent Clp protease ATP-binding subunit ClpA